MTNDEALLKELDKTTISKDIIGNGEYITAKGKGTVAIESFPGTETITNMLYVPDIN